jgi:hypothetical protein
MEKSDVTNVGIKIERCKKMVQIIKKEGSNTIEITSVNLVKKLNSKKEEINNCVISMCKDKEELNVIIISNTKKLKDDEVVDFPKLVKNEEGKLTMICEGKRKSEFEAVFKDNPIISLPLDVKNEKKIDMKEEVFEEKYCHGKAMGEERNNEEMLGGDFSLKANLKRQEDESVKTQFQEKRKKIDEFLKNNIETRLHNKEIIVQA